MARKITKLSIARSVYASVYASGCADPRKEFLAKFEAAHIAEFGVAPKENLGSTYHQMLNYEREHKAGGVYRHHRGVKVTPIAIVEVPEASQDVAPLTAEDRAELEVEEAAGDWKVNLDGIDYLFDTRAKARDFKAAHPEAGKVEKVA
jgi:hypothetical protein